MNAIPLLSCFALVLAASARADSLSATTTTTIGGAAQQLNLGAEALRRRDYREGIALTLEGLSIPNPPRDIAAAHANLCAGYAALKEFELALQACNRSLALDRGNWRTWNNRAAVHLGRGHHHLALADVQAGLAIAPNSQTLRQTRAIVEARIRARDGASPEDAAKVIKA